MGNLWSPSYVGMRNELSPMKQTNSVAKRTLLMAGALIAVILIAVASKASTVQTIWMK